VRALDQAAVDLIVTLYRDERLSVARTAEKTGVSVNRVRTVVERAGISRGHSTAGTGDLRGAVIQACADGMTQEEAAAACGVGRIRAGQLLQGPGGLLPPSYAAAVAGITVAGLERLGVSGTVRRVRGDNGRYRYFRDDMEALRRVEALRWVFADAYSVTADEDGKLHAHRLDFTRTVYADTPEGLRRAIMEDCGHRVTAR